MRFLERYPAYVEWRQRSAAIKPVGGEPARGTEPQDETPEQQIEAIHTALMSALQSDLLERVPEMPPASFERLIVDLLIEMGYGDGRREMGQAIGRAGDAGIEGMIKEDTLGLDIVYMQAKLCRRQYGRTGGGAKLAGSLDGVRATKGIFFATSTFSQGARDYVGRISKHIVLIDRAELSALMVRNSVGVRTRTKYEIKTIDEDYFSE
jgi:restriction system protein